MKSDILDKIGTILTEPMARDAIHIAVLPVIAGNMLNPGDHVGFVGGEIDIGALHPIGVIDPFLKAPVEKGQGCFVFLYPNTITDMRHHWKHPGIPDDQFRPVDPAKYIKASIWLREFAVEAGIDFEEMMTGIDRYIETGWDKPAGKDYDAQIAFDNHRDEFWDQWSAFTGRDIPDNDRSDNPFECGC